METRLGLIEFNRRGNSFFNSISYQIERTAIIDPGDVWDGVGFDGIKSVLLTHAHYDHIYGLNELAAISPDIIVYTNRSGYEMLLDAKKNMSLYHESPFVFNSPERICIVSDGEIIELGNGIAAQAIFTPGHNPSCITWVINDMVFSGDSYIPGIKTVTNLPGGNKEQAAKSEALIKRISKDKILYPGHYVSPI